MIVDLCYFPSSVSSQPFVLFRDMLDAAIG